MSAVASDAPALREEPARWLAFWLFAAFGAHSPRAQIVASVLLAVGFYLATSIGLFVTIGFALLFTVTALIGVLRLLIGVIR
jgi:hypothetical protein